MQRHGHESAHEGSHVKADGVNAVGKEHGDAFALFEAESRKGMGPAHDALVRFLNSKGLPLFDAVAVVHVNRNLRPLLQMVCEQFGKRAQNLKLGAARLHGIGFIGHCKFLCGDGDFAG